MRDHGKGGALTEVTFFILLSLVTPRHGYGIMQFVEEKTQGRLVLGAGTLYGALTALEEKGWIQPLTSTGRKKEFVLTPEGRAVCQRELVRLRELLTVAEEIMEGDHG